MIMKKFVTGTQPLYATWLNSPYGAPDLSIVNKIKSHTLRRGLGLIRLLAPNYHPLLTHTTTRLAQYQHTFLAQLHSFTDSYVPYYLSSILGIKIKCNLFFMWITTTFAILVHAVVTPPSPLTVKLPSCVVLIGLPTQFGPKTKRQIFSAGILIPNIDLYDMS